MRLFVGVPIPEDVRLACGEFQRELPHSLKFVRAEQFHFTLKPQIFHWCAHQWNSGVLKNHSQWHA